MGKKRLLVIIPNLGTGGAQKVYRQQMVSLSDKYEVFGCVFNWDGSFQEDRTSNMFSLGVPAGKNVFLKAWYFLLRIVRLRKLKQHLQIDVAISHLEGADYVNLLSRKREKVICWIHGTKKHDANIEGLLGWLRKKILIPFTYGRASLIVTVSDGIRLELRNDFGVAAASMITIQNGFDVEQIESYSNEPLGSDDKQIFRHQVMITHCRLAVQKNLFALLRIFAEFRTKSNVKLVVLGDGELRQTLLNECRKLGLRTFTCWESSKTESEFDIYFLGFKKNPYRYLSKASLYVMTSGWEGFPLALCEAMACGLPVVSTDCFTGPKEIIAPGETETESTKALIKGQFGYLLPLVNPNSEQEVIYWAKSLESILSDPKELKALAARGRLRVSNFSINETIRLTFKAIDSL